MKLLNPKIFFTENSAAGLNLLIVFTGLVLFIRPGVYLPSTLLTYYVPIVHVIAHVIVSLLCYALFVGFALWVMRFTTQQLTYKTLFFKLGYIELPRLLFGAMFYIYYAFGDTTRFTPLLLLLVIVGVLSRVGRVLLLFNGVKIMGQISTKKALLITAVLLVTLFIINSMFDPMGIDHPYVSIFFKHIDV